LAQSVSQQEYSRLFQSDGFGAASTTEYLSRGAWLESAAQYGVFGPIEYALSGFYHSDPGQRANNDLQQTELSAQAKYQLTSQDSIYLRATYGETKAGDLTHYFDPASVNPFVRVKETQEPILIAGYHREWSPGNHSLLLFGRLQDTLRVSDPIQGTLLLERDAAGNVVNVTPGTIQQDYKNQFELYSGEAQQIWEREKLTLIGGLRFQKGELETTNQHANPSFFPFSLQMQPQQATSDIDRLSVYAYGLWRALPSLQLIAGLSYDRLHFPVNFRYAPISEAEDNKDQWSPKFGAIWTPFSGATVRAAYTRSLGGVSFDQSFRLEPTQVAGFVQSFRSLIPESVAGATAASTFDTWGISLEQKFVTGTYAGVGAEWLESDVDRVVGVYEPVSLFSFTPSGTPQELRYKEKALTASVYQLIGRDWTFGARYRLSESTLGKRFPEIAPGTPSTSPFVAIERDKSLLHELKLFTVYNHPFGFFGEIEANWYLQHNHGYVPALPSEDFWHFNAFLGYRFAHRHAEMRLGVLNLADRDYRLSPLSGLSEFPRERTIAASFRFYF
jgi:outer membrane receptor protein involved in Fe transport